MKPQKITKKRMNRHDVFYDVIETWIDESLRRQFGVDTILYLKTGAYHCRYFFTLRKGDEDMMHLILSRKCDYITKAIVHRDIEKVLGIEEISRYIQKHFTTSRDKTVIRSGDLFSTKQYHQKKTCDL